MKSFYWFFSFYFLIFGFCVSRRFFFLKMFFNSEYFVKEGDGVASLERKVVSF